MKKLIQINTKRGKGIKQIRELYERESKGLNYTVWLEINLINLINKYNKLEDRFGKEVYG